jgi:opacity protein-like surface antigen
MKKILLAASAIALLSSAAFAQDSNLRFGLGVSSMGATLEGAYRFNQNWAVRGVVAGGLGINGTQTIDGVNYDTNGQLGGFALLADYYTGNSGFRVSGGAFVSNTSFSGSATASPANPIEIGGTTLVGGESTSASIEFSRKVSPMLTVSYDWNIGRSFTLSGEIGAIGMGGLNVSVTAPAVAATEIAAEVQSINDELSQFGVYPYIAITGSFRF